jgi:integrase
LVSCELVSKNPVLPVETRSATSYKAILVTPQQTLAIIQSLPNVLHRILVLTCAATALRSSELLALRWSDVLWEEAKIAITKRWSRGKTGQRRPVRQKDTSLFTLTLAYHLKEWRTNALRQGDGLRIPVADGRGPCAAISRRLCCRPSPAGSSKSGCPDS